MATSDSSTQHDDSAMAVRARMQALIQGDVAASNGRLPTEREMSATLGISRRALRRALETLDAEGLIWRRQGKGTFAGQPPDPTQALAAGIVGDTNFMDIMAARLCLEPGIAGLAALRATTADVERMRNLAGRTVQSQDGDSTELWDGALHRLIARTAGNAPLMTAISMLDEIRGNAAWCGLRAKARSLETLKVSDREHRAIIDAIEAGHQGEAEAAMRAHLTTLSDNLKRILPHPKEGD